jgi:hypothetical protein
MGATARKFKPARRALIALFVLSFGWMTPTISLAQPEPIVCGMACCREEVVCCCARASASDERSTLEASVPLQAEIQAVTITASCPPQCAQIPTGSSHYFIAKARSPHPATMPIVPPIRHMRSPHFTRDALVDAASSPRAPPASWPNPIA